MRAPKKLYWVELEEGAAIGFRQSGGGKFSNLKAAQDRLGYLKSRGREATLYECEPVWTPVVDTDLSSA